MAGVKVSAGRGGGGGLLPWLRFPFGELSTLLRLKEEGVGVFESSKLQIWRRHLKDHDRLVLPILNIVALNNNNKRMFSCIYFPFVSYGVLYWF